jgi:DNA (cytosine-5)-methyltransferase 1
MSQYTCASFFAGVGGIDLGFEQNGFKVIYANEMDDNAVKTYETNFDIKVDHRKIEQVKNSEIPNFDILLAGFPCQSFSIAGYQKGFKDKKNGHLFFELERIFSEKKPEVIFLENVKNLVSHDNGKTFRIILETLKANNYFVKYQVLNGKDYGNTPQNRERIYIVAFKDKTKFERFNFPDPIQLTRKLSDVINFEEKKDSKYYYSAKKCCFYSVLKKGMKKQDTIYQWRRKYVRENKSNVCPTLTANMGTGGHNVPLVLTNTGIRKLTPHECFNLQGFPADYKLPNIANTHLYKQAGNSVVVSVISRIAQKIKEAL